MPCYDIQCDDCGRRWETVEPADTPRERACAYCGGAAQRLFPAPAIFTDKTYMAGRPMLGDEYAGDEQALAYRLGRARRRGCRPNPHDLYEPCLVDPDVGPGDPDAFVPHDNARAHIDRVKKKLRSKKYPKGPPIAENILRRMMASRIRCDPSLAKDVGALRQSIIEAHGRKD